MLFDTFDEQERLLSGAKVKSDSELRADIRSRCERVKNALDDCPITGLLRFYQALGTIHANLDTVTGADLRAADSRLDALIKELQVTKDVNGEKILGYRRWEKFM